MLLEPQRHRPVSERDFADDVSTAPAHAVLVAEMPQVGDALIIDHRVPHDVLPCDEARIVIRTDIIYERCGLPECASEKTVYPEAALPDAAAAWRIHRRR